MDSSAPTPLTLPASPDVLADLELYEHGILDSAEIDTTLGRFVGNAEGDFGRSPTHLVLTEAEGVPLVSVLVVPSDTSGTEIGSLEVLQERPRRPFEALHKGPRKGHRPSVTVLIDGKTSAEQVLHVAADAESVLLLLTVCVEVDGETLAPSIRACRFATALGERAASAGTRPEVTVRVAPVPPVHPLAAARIASCVAAYSAGGQAVDLRGRSDVAHESMRPGGVIMFTGLSGSGKSTIAKSVRNALLERTNGLVTLLDGDVVRRHLSAGLGFGMEDRNRNVERIGWVGARIAEHGGLAICSPIAPFEATRQRVRTQVVSSGSRFVLVHISTPLEECERRDRKGLYARARTGEIPDFTGISSPYETPIDPDVSIDTTHLSVVEATELVLRLGQQRHLWRLDA